MTLKKRTWGTLSNGDEVELYILDSGSMRVCATNYGAIITSIQMPSKTGNVDDIALGFSTLSDYTQKHPFFGAIAGRFANRIAGGEFTIDDKRYELQKNNPLFMLHGGSRGFDKYVWDAIQFEEGNTVNVSFSMVSPNGDAGFPGNLSCKVTYSLSSDNCLTMKYEAESDQKTHVNLTNHTYFNLKGEGSGDILDHELTIHASKYVEIAPNLLPTGILKAVDGEMDFRKTKTIGADLAKTPAGYDHCYVLDSSEKGLKPCAEVFEKTTGRRMKISATQPGVQFYSGNFLEGWKGKRGSIYDKYSGFCLETEHFPDSPNQAGFPSTLLEKGQKYEHIAKFEFSW